MKFSAASDNSITKILGIKEKTKNNTCFQVTLKYIYSTLCEFYPFFIIQKKSQNTHKLSPDPQSLKMIPSTLSAYLSVHLTWSFPHLSFQKYSLLQFPEIYSVRFLKNSKRDRKTILWLEFTKYYWYYPQIIMVKDLSFVELHPKTPRIYSALNQIEPVLLLGIKQNWFL